MCFDILNGWWCWCLLRVCGNVRAIYDFVTFLDYFVAFRRVSSFEFEGSNGKRSVEKRGYRGNDRQGDGIFFGDEDEDTWGFFSFLCFFFFPFFSSFYQINVVSWTMNISDSPCDVGIGHVAISPQLQSFRGVQSFSMKFWNRTVTRRGFTAGCHILHFAWGFFAPAAPTSGQNLTKLQTAQLVLYYIYSTYPSPRRDPTTDSGDRPRQRFVKCDVIFIFPEVGRISKKWLEDLF